MNYYQELQVLKIIYFFGTILVQMTKTIEPIISNGLFFWKNSKVTYGFSTHCTPQETVISQFPNHRCIMLKQIHSAAVFFADTINPLTEGDGLIIQKQDQVAIIKTADCIPLFFWDSKKEYAGIIHVGWRGLLANIHSNLLNMLSKQSALDSFCFVIGPAIEAACYEVGSDLYDSFSKRLPPDRFFISKTKNKYDFDLKKALAWSLTENGICHNQITDMNICTFCRPDLPSYRRDGKTDQRIYNFIHFTPAPD
jgi:YfiH family protein